VANIDKSAVISRYRNSYQIADTAMGFAVRLRVLAVIGVALVVLGLVLAIIPRVTVGPVLMVLGIYVALGCYVLSILIASVAHITRATTDAAVHTSPFLSDDERAELVMSLL